MWAGLTYLREFMVGRLWNAPLVVGTLLGFTIAGRQRQAGPLALVLLAWFAYVTWIGGDAFFGSRFYVPIVPLLVLVTVAGIGHLLAGSAGGASRLLDLRPGAPRFGWAGDRISDCAHGSLRARQLETPLRLSRTHRVALSALVVGLAIENSGLPKQATIAVLAAGMTPYFAPSYRFHDMLGKCDRLIASGVAHAGQAGHRKWNLRYSLDVVKPQLVVTSGRYDLSRSDADYQKAAATDQVTPFAPALWVDPSFRAHYRDHRVFIFFHNLSLDTGQWLFARDDVPLRQIELASSR